MNPSGAPFGAGFETRVVTFQEFELEVHSAGHKSDPRLIVLPGAGGVAKTPALDLLANRFHVMVLQLPGFGNQANDAADFDAFATQVSALICDALEVSSCYLLGTSFGGAVALHLATQQPQLIRALALEAPAEQRMGGQHPSTMTPDQLARSFRSHPEREPVFVLGPPPGGPQRWEMIDRLMGDGTLSNDFSDRLSTCLVRTLIVWGANDGIIPLGNAATYQRLLQNSTLRIVEDAAHDVQSDQPDLFASIVGDYFSKS